MANQLDPLQAVGELISYSDFQNYFDAPDERARNVLRDVLTTAPERLRELIRVAGSEDLQRSPEMLAHISIEHLLEVQQILRLPQSQWSRLIEATTRSPAALRDAIRTLRDSGRLSDVDWDALLDASPAPFRSRERFGSPRTNWLSRLSTPQQLGLLVALLEALNEAAKLLENLTHEKAPEDIQPAIAVVFAVTAVLLMIVDAKTKSPE